MKPDSWRWLSSSALGLDKWAWRNELKVASLKRESVIIIEILRSSNWLSVMVADLSSFDSPSRLSS